MRDLGGPYEYGCPLCLCLFSRDQIEDLSLDDVPPKTVGAKLKVLTCEACNSTAGHQLDYLTSWSATTMVSPSMTWQGR